MFTDTRIPLLNVCTQSVCYPAMVLLFLWKPHSWFSIHITVHPQSAGKWIKIPSAKITDNWSGLVVPTYRMGLVFWKTFKNY